MPPRYLFGPVTPEFADQNLAAARAAGDCLCFGTVGVDLPIAAGDGWDELCARLPAGWRPDMLVLSLQYATIPAALWRAPVPVVGLAGDWNLQWASYRATLPLCDLVLTDTAGVEVMHRAGIPQARQAYLFGLPRATSDADWPDGERPIDVLFVGNVHPAVQRERLPWIPRLARLSGHRNVVIRAGVFGADYRRLLGQARIVFNRSIRGECNLRAFEAVAAGALLFQERDNRELPALLEDRRECVYYAADDLERLLDYYLDHEDERKAIAAAARRSLTRLSFEALWAEELRRIAEELPTLREHAGRRATAAAAPSPEGRVWQMAAAGGTPSAEAVREVEQAARAVPRSAVLENALGAAYSLAAPHDPGRAARAFQDAWNADPRHVIAGGNLAEVLVKLEQRDHAAEQARRTLAVLDTMDGLPASLLDAPLLPAGYDLFRVEWERAAWANAGRPADERTAKATLLRWRLHTLLGEVTGELAHYYEAGLLRPDLPATRAALGCALGRANHLAEAAGHLRAAVAGNPFDREAAAALAATLGRLGRTSEQQRLAQARRRLSAAAPGLTPPEPWFAEPAAPPAEVAPPAAAPLRIAWQGSFEAMHSLALVNRELGAALARRGHEVMLLPATSADPPGTRCPLPPELHGRLGAAPSGPAEVHVRHQWPPDFTPPAEGHWVMIQPWEFGSPPRDWVGPMSRLLDEVWVPSHFVRDGYLQGGVPADRVHVVPNAVGEVFLREDRPPYPLATGKRFKFLFVGGTIDRKGIDVLLKAYTQTFSAGDDVCLVVKDMGVGTFYQGQTMEARIAALAQQPGAPAVEYLGGELTEEQMAGLYGACDCLVAPYRGEGFGLPILEAMACGVPVIVTGYGAALDYCRDEWAYLIPARPRPLPDARIGVLETVDRPHLAEPDGDALRLLLRHVVEHPEEARAMAERARRHVRSRYTWAHAAAAAEARLAELCRRPIRRLLATNGVPPARPKVSLTMIVKNEEENLGACLASVADLVDELIVVDTGSTDRTVEIARRLGARVFHFPWVDSFAAARNEALQHATGEWVFWMDADDRLDGDNRERLRRLVTELPGENVAYVFKCLCLPDRESGVATAVDHVRLFRNLPGLAWEHRIHEQILPALKRRGATVRWSDVVVHHVGYVDPALRRRKQERDRRILEREYAEQPDHPFTLFNLGNLYRETGRTAEALALFRRSLAGSHPSDSIVRKLYTLVASCERHLGRHAEALAACREGRGHYPDDAEILLQEAEALRSLGDRAGAVGCLERLLAGRDGAHFASVDTGLAYKARHLLALLLKEEGRHAEAEGHWRQVLAEDPAFLPALVGLGELYLAGGVWPRVEHVLGQIEARWPGSLPALVLRGHLHLERGEYPAAREWLGRAIAAGPHEVWPRVLYSRVLLREGGEPAAAERALRDVLGLDPAHAETRDALDGLLRRRDGTSAA